MNTALTFLATFWRSAARSRQNSSGCNIHALNEPIWVYSVKETVSIVDCGARPVINTRCGCHPEPGRRVDQTLVWFLGFCLVRQAQHATQFVMSNRSATQGNTFTGKGKLPFGRRLLVTLEVTWSFLGSHRLSCLWFDKLTMTSQ